MTEISKKGDILWHAFIGSGKQARQSRVQNYRAFKFECEGTPKEEPAVVGLAYRASHGDKLLPYDSISRYSGKKGASIKLLVAASWNGDTEVKQWQFETKTVEKEDLVAKVERVGFETRATIDVKEDVEEVRAVGLDEKGNTLVVTRWETIKRNRPVPPLYRAKGIAPTLFNIQIQQRS